MREIGLLQKRTTLALLSISLLWAPFTKPQSLTQHLTVAEAETLVYAATDPQLRGVPLQEDQSLYEPDFISLVAIDTNPDHPAELATYAVNARTGDVWNTKGRCRHLNSVKLRGVLKQLQTRIDIDSVGAEELHREEPRVCQAKSPHPKP
jgi:hypothetical protein